jgi:hypothetical protein
MLVGKPSEDKFRMSLLHTIKAKNDSTRDVELTPLKSIHLHCVECLGFAVRAVKACETALCPLYPYRMGTNPSRAGIGGIRRQRPNLRRHLRKV